MDQKLLSAVKMKTFNLRFLWFFFFFSIIPLLPKNCWQQWKWKLLISDFCDLFLVQSLFFPKIAGSSENEKLFVTDFLWFLFGFKSIQKRCKTSKTEFIDHTYVPRYGLKNAASNNNGSKICHRLMWFLFGCKCICKWCKTSKTESIYHTHDPKYGSKNAASSKKWKHFVTIFVIFI